MGKFDNIKNFISPNGNNKKEEANKEPEHSEIVEKLILPDYTMEQTNSEQYNISTRTAKLFKSFNIKSNEYPQGNFFVEKLRWNKFITSTEGYRYITLKLIFNDVTHKFIKDKLSHIKGTDGIAFRLSEEYKAINNNNIVILEDNERTTQQAIAMLNYY